MAWQPEPEPLRQLANYLKDTLSGHDNRAQENASLMLDQARQSPDIDMYLAYLMANSSDPNPVAMKPMDYQSARSAAALMLKNNVKSSYRSIPRNNLSYIRSLTLIALQDQSLQIRNFSGNVITELVKQGSLISWPELMPQLFALVANEPGDISAETQVGAMKALVKICEDNRDILDRAHQGQRPLSFVMPKLFECLTSQQAAIRADALACIIVFIPQMPPALLQMLDALIHRLFQLATDSSTEVRKFVCRSIVNIAEVRPEKIVPHISDLVDYFVAQQRKGEDEELALDAAEFWLSIAEHPQLRLVIGPHLAKIIPVLLETMVYSEEEILMLEGDAEDANEEDKLEDIKPQFARGKGARSKIVESQRKGAGYDLANGGSTKSASNSAKPESADDELSDGEVEEGEDDNSEDEGMDPEEKWTLRKCSAAALDAFSTYFHGDIFEIIRPYLTENIQHAEWPYREASVLALGAIADGCMDSVTPHLPGLIPYLLSLLDDVEPVVRKITCWTLGRYSGWASHLDDASMTRQYFEPIIGGLLRKMLDRNKSVQEAAASAFANLEEKASIRLAPYCKPIVQQFAESFQSYQDRNMSILYDCVQTLAQFVGPAIAEESVTNLLVPALINRWSKISSQSQEVFMVLECLSYVATALGREFSPFAEIIFQRCIEILHQNLEDQFAASRNPSLDQPSKDFLITSLDLISAIIQSISAEQSTKLVLAASPGFFGLLNVCMEDPSAQVRQSSYALLGDCAIYLPLQTRQYYLATILPTLLQQLDLEALAGEDAEAEYSVVNNACWAVGELSYRDEEDMKPWIEKVYVRLQTIMLDSSVTDSVRQNAAIALGRSGIPYSQQISPHLTEFAASFLDCMKDVDYTEEKDTAFHGFSYMVLQNPSAMENTLQSYLSVISQYKRQSQKRAYVLEVLIPIFQMLITQYSSLLPKFGDLVQRLDLADQQALKQDYRLSS